jgi:hypothetical protein
VSLRSDIHDALPVVTPPHLEYTVMEAIRRQQPARRARLRPAATLMVALIVIAGGAAIAVALASLRAQSPSGPGTLTHQAGPPIHLVVTTWVNDPSVTGGAHPGYRPQLIGLDGSMVTSAQAVRGPCGPSWCVDVAFNSEGTRVLSTITSTPPAPSCAAESVCARANLTTWAGLTQDDLDHWSERANRLSQSFNRGGKLLVDARVEAPIMMGHTLISVPNLTQQEAHDLALRIQYGG